MNVGIRSLVLGVVVIWNPRLEAGKIINVLQRIWIAVTVLKSSELHPNNAFLCNSNKGVGFLCVQNQGILVIGAKDERQNINATNVLRWKHVS